MHTIPRTSVRNGGDGSGDGGRKSQARLSRRGRLAVGVVVSLLLHVVGGFVLAGIWPWLAPSHRVLPFRGGSGGDIEVTLQSAAPSSGAAAAFSASPQRVAKRSAASRRSASDAPRRVATASRPSHPSGAVRSAPTGGASTGRSAAVRAASAPSATAKTVATPPPPQQQRILTASAAATNAAPVTVALLPGSASSAFRDAPPSTALPPSAVSLPARPVATPSRHTLLPLTPSASSAETAAPVVAGSAFSAQRGGEVAAAAGSTERQSSGGRGMEAGSGAESGGGGSVGGVRGLPFGGEGGNGRGGSGGGGGSGSGPGVGGGGGGEDRPMHAVYVLDCSGSMRENNKIYYARQALTQAIVQLHPGDSFDIITFNTNAKTMWRDFQPATPRTIRDAVRRMNDIEPPRQDAGTTNYSAAFDAVGALNGVTHIFFITDGIPSAGVGVPEDADAPTDFAALHAYIRAANRERAVIYTFAISDEDSWAQEFLSDVDAAPAATTSSVAVAVSPSAAPKAQNEVEHQKLAQWQIETLREYQGGINLLKQIAAETGGTYRFVDVLKQNN